MHLVPHPKPGPHPPLPTPPQPPPGEKKTSKLAHYPVLVANWQNWMTKEEYEQQYSDAIYSLKHRGHQIGNPSLSHDGVRAIRVDNFPWTDTAVFEEAWGKEAAVSMAADQPSPHKAPLPGFR